MLVSIVITSYNYEAYIGEAIDSALNQTHPDVEVIVVDDGSTDGSREIIAGFGDRIQTILRDNGGQSASCNMGFARSRGEVVIFLDADDVLLPQAAALHAREFAEAPDTVKSAGYMNVINGDGSDAGYRLPRQLPQSGNYRDETLKHGLETIRNSFTSGQAWSRNFLLQVLPLPTDDLIGTDGYLTAVDRLFGRLAYIHTPVVNYRRHARNKGPIRYRFDREYMQQRLNCKRRRIAFAENWIKRLNLDYDAQQLHTLRDWRLVLMQHALSLMGSEEAPVSLQAMCSAPFRNVYQRADRAFLTAVALCITRLLPRRPSLAVASHMLERSH